MDVATVAHHYIDRFKTRHGASTTSDQWSALNAIMGCRTAQYAPMYIACPGCDWHSTRYQSCGHRSCNRCQNHSTGQWLDRQTTKLLPVEYFMVTFTLPYELRALAKANQKQLYSLLFDCAVATLKDFGRNDKAFAAEMAMTAVLHTHTRQLDYHPHVHVIIPGGGISKDRRAWKKVKGKYLFNGYALAAVFKGKLLRSIEQAGLSLPPTPKKWVVQCQHVGSGLPALKYLSRYLYRGVISNKNIVSDDGETVSFRYKDSKTGTIKTRRLPGEDFIRLILQHTLPKGFRRVRDYGFLHGNAKRLLKTVQWILRVVIPKSTEKPRPHFICKKCYAPMLITGFGRRKLQSG
jgi:hypothetical protein